MRCIVNIGHTQVLLPDDKCLSTIMAALAKGVECYSIDHGLCGEPIRTTGKPMRVSCQMVPDGTPIEVGRDLYSKDYDSTGTVSDVQFPGTALSTRVKRPAAAKTNGHAGQRRLPGPGKLF